MNKKHDNEKCLNEDPSTLEKEKIGRRDFLKIGSVAGVAAGLSLLPAGKTVAAEKTAKKAAEKILPSMPYRINNKFKPMDHKNTIFARARWDKTIIPDAKKFFGPKEPKNEPGWTQLEAALCSASRSIYSMISGGSASGQPNSPAYKWDIPASKNKYTFKDKADATQKIKRAARFMGASLVGIADYDERWNYDPIFDLKKKEPIPVKFPFQPKSVVVMALEMDYENFATAPSLLATAGADINYSRMAVVASSVADFIRKLGYNSIALGNDVAQSIPYAIAAGLGELGRNGLLVTYEYGPRVRICKIFTELELVADKPKTFGVVDFCKSCKRCAESCPGKAIPMGDPTWEGETLSNNPGIYKWYINPEKCFHFWGENQGDCGTCISSCPYNKPDFWHHKVITAMTSLPGAAVHATMTQMDKMFGYGNIYDKKAVIKWWGQED